MEQRVLVIEIEPRPNQAGTIYASATDAESRINEALADGWSIKHIHQGTQHERASVVIVELMRD